MQHCNEEIQSQPVIVSIKSKGFDSGTGFFVRENLIATNIHCVAGATSVSAKLLGSNIEYSVEGVVAFDDKNDLVILKVSGIGTSFPIGDSDMIEKGEYVQAVGCIGEKHVITGGEFHSFLNNGQWLQTTVKTKDGYSGGPLLDSTGLVIGVNFGDVDYYSAAISSKILKKLLFQINEIEPFAQWQKIKLIKAYDFLAQEKLENKNQERAIVYLDKTIQLNPEIIIAYFNRGSRRQDLAQFDSEEGNLIAAQQHWQSSVDDFTQAINLCPDYVPAYNNRADAQLHLAKSENIETSQGLYQDARKDINIAIRKCPNNPIEEDIDIALCHHTRGEIKEAMGDLSGAKNDFEKAMTNSGYTNDSTISDDLKRVKDKLRQ